MTTVQQMLQEKLSLGINYIVPKGYRLVATKDGKFKLQKLTRYIGNIGGK